MYGDVPPDTCKFATPDEPLKQEMLVLEILADIFAGSLTVNNLEDEQLALSLTVTA